MLEEMRTVMELLNAQRVKRGSIDFDLDEAAITLNPCGKPTVFPLHHAVFPTA